MGNFRRRCNIPSLPPVCRVKAERRTASQTQTKGDTMNQTTIKCIATLALAGTMLFSVVACGGSSSGTSGDNGSTSQQGERIPDPFQEFDSAEDAQKAAGFDITVPDPLDDTWKGVYRVDVDGKLIEVIYNQGNPDDSWEAYRIRKGAGTDDVSGDYNDYAETTEEEVDGKTVTLKGEGGKVTLATWTDGGYSYSISAAPDGPFDAGMEKGDVVSLVAAIR